MTECHLETYAETLHCREVVSVTGSTQDTVGTVDIGGNINVAGMPVDRRPCPRILSCKEDGNLLHSSLPGELLGKGIPELNTL